MNRYIMGPQEVVDYGIPFNMSEECGEYREVASFSSDDIQEIVDQNKDFIEEHVDFNFESREVNEMCRERGVDVMHKRYFLEINLKHSEENEYDIANNLVLDGCCEKYVCDVNGFLIDGILFYPNFNLRGIFEDVYAKNTDRNLRFSVCENNIESYRKGEEGKVDTTYGFKLSQILENIGDLESINEKREIISLNEYANIIFTQKAVIYKKCSTRFIVFKFTIKNDGSYVAKKILFKDIFPQNIKVLKDGIFLNGLKIDEEKVNFEGRRLLIKIEELQSGQEINLTIVGILCEDCKTINVGVLSYISGYTQQEGIRRLNINQVMSNMKIIREKGCN